MELFGNYLMAFIETGGLFAPILFISFHLLRPLFFLPVVFICISGGILFGAVAGTVYSIIGITLSSIIFYYIIKWMPKTFKKLLHVKKKLIGNHSVLTTPQITLLRLVPFIHFHLLSLCLIEISASFKDYTKLSLLSNIPLAFVYTSIGQWISNLTPIHIFAVLIALLPFLYLLRKKEIIIKWQEFFQLSTR
ncbi:TVP38/TMEM64 family protein [Virgibacillus ainsalahensis]